MTEFASRVSRARSFVRTLVLSLILSAFSITAQAQSNVPILHGRVTDIITGSPVPSAEVRLSRWNDGSALSAAPARADILLRTDEHGRWTTRQLAPGRWQLFIRVLGYAPHNAGLDVNGGANDTVVTALRQTVANLQSIVVTAANREQLLKDVVVTTEVLSAKQIRESGASSLSGVLAQHSGLSIEGGHPAGEGVMLQGMGSQRVLILLDGQPLTGRIAGVLDASRIPAAIIERIEIVKGPQSTLYGSEAMGGVVNVITRQPISGMLDLEARLLGGSEKRMEAGAHAAYGAGQLAASIDVGHRRDGVAPGVQLGTGALALRTDLSVSAAWNGDNGVTASGALVAVDERQRWRSSGIYSFSDNTEWSARADTRIPLGASALSATAFATVNDHLSRASILPQPIAGDDGEAQIQRLYRLELLWQLPMDAALRNSVDIGAHLRRDEMETTRITGERRSRHSVEPFAQLQYSITPALALLGGARLSSSSSWGTRVTPRLSARLNVADEFALRASVAAGYRTPDFKEQYMFFQNIPAGYSVLGNPDLSPESSRNFTAAAEWTGETLRFTAQIFRNTYTDFIETRTVSLPDQPLVFQYSNVAEGLTQGADLQGSVLLGRVRADAGASLLRAEERNTGAVLLGRPKRSARVALGYALPTGTHARVSLSYTGRTPMQRDDESGVVTGWREQFVRTDLHLTQQLRPGLELMFGTDNMLDQRPANWSGVTQRRTWVGLSWNRSTGIN